jgi:hypothetical protein
MISEIARKIFSKRSGMTDVTVPSELGAKQEEFAKCLAEFILWIYSQGWKVRIGEVYRPPFTAKEYARQGKGIANSVHTKKLAVDMFLVMNGSVTWKNDDYAPLAEQWKSMHPLARAGHDFKSKDSVHFSFEHGGVK